MNKERKSLAKFLGSKIKILRIQHNMKQKELADKLGFTQAYLSDLERGRTMVPTDMLFEIAKIFGANLNYFAVGAGNSYESDIPNVLEKRLNALEKEIQEIKGQIQTVHD